jgi:hypothetical protein
MNLDKQLINIQLTLAPADGATSTQLFYHKGYISEEGNKIRWFALQVTADGKFTIYRITDRFAESFDVESKVFTSGFTSIKKTGTMTYVNRMSSNKHSNIIKQTAPSRKWLFYQVDWNSGTLVKVIEFDFQPDSSSDISYLTRYNDHLYFKVTDGSTNQWLYYVDLSTVGTGSIISSYTWRLSITKNKTDFCAGQNWLYVMEDGSLKLHTHGSNTPTTTYSSIIADTVVEIREIDDNDIFVRASGAKLYRIETGVATLLTSALTTDTQYFRVNTRGTIYTEAITITQTPNQVDTHTDNWYTISENAEINAYLTGIVKELCNEIGVADENLNVFDLDDTIVQGYLISSYNTQNNFLTELMTPYYFDMIESENKLKFIKRGGSSTKTLDSNRLGATIGSSIGNTFPEKLARTLEASRTIPKTVRVIYLEALKDYDQVEQSITRQDAVNRDELVLDMQAFTWSDSVARQVAERTIAIMFTEREQYVIYISAYYFDIEPTDILTVSVDGENKRLRVTSTSYTYPGIMEIQAILDDAEDYTSNATGVTGDGGGSEYPSNAETQIIIVDTNYLNSGDADETGAGFYASMRNLISTISFSGAELLKRDQGDGDNWTSLGFYGNEVIAGQCITKLEDGITSIIERKNTLQVKLFKSTDSLIGISEDDLIDGLNLCVVGNNNTWEIIRFQNATSLGGSKWQIDTFVRGVSGTEHLTSSHAVGDYFIYLPDGIGNNLVNIQKIAKTDINDLFDYTAKGLNDLIPEDEDDIELFSATLYSNRHKAYAVDHISATKDGITSDVTITWVRRCRYSGEWLDYIDVPETEPTELYQIDVISGTSVKRTLISTTTSVTYTSDQQVTDFGSNISILNCKIYKMNGDFGRGYEKEATITL